MIKVNGGIVNEDIINLFNFTLTYNIFKWGENFVATHPWVVTLGTSHSKYVLVIQIWISKNIVSRRCSTRWGLNEVNIITKKSRVSLG